MKILKRILVVFVSIVCSGIMVGCDGGGGNPPPPKYSQIFYRPTEGVLADVIPYYENGEFNLFYLQDYRNIGSYGVGVDWNLLKTKDFVNYTNEGTVIKRGTTLEQDNCVFTGGIIKVGSKYHIFYTGHNDLFPSKGLPKEAIMHAISDDKLTWTKVPQDTFYAPTDKYTKDDWRDPFVYFDDVANDYKMILATRKKDGADSTRGVTAMLSSKDLASWQVEEPLFLPNKYHTQECPDLFKIGDWWYLVFSEFSDRISTRYVMSKDLKQWIEPPMFDGFDGRAFYAAKTVGDDNNRYIFGWVPTKENDMDKGGWQWGGSLVVHEVYQNNDGTLSVKQPKFIDSTFSNIVKQCSKEELSAHSGVTKYKELFVRSSNLNCFKFDCTITFNELPTKVGVSIQHGEELNTNYRYVLDTGNKVFQFENYPGNSYFKDVVVPYRFYKNSKVSLSIIVENDVCTAYLNGQIALSSRMNDIEKTSKIAVFIEGGAVEFSNIKIMSPNK